MSNTNKAERLRHSLKAHVRSIQMSNRSFFAYCEGRNSDPYIYSEIIRKHSPHLEGKFTIYKLDEITGTGGKDSLTKLFRYFRKHDLLDSNYKDKSFLCVFFLDKDIDDLRRATLRSKHVLYTELYDIEAHVFRDSDLKRIIAVALSIDVSTVPDVYNKPKEWLENKAIAWREWITLCTFSRLHNVDCGCNFGRPSGVNTDLIGKLDQTKYSHFQSALAAKMVALSAAPFSASFQKTEKIVDRLIRKKSLAFLMKGKWLVAILTKELQQAFSGRSASLGNVAPRLTPAAVSHFDFNSNWAIDLGTRILQLSLMR